MELAFCLLPVEKNLLRGRAGQKGYANIMTSNLNRPFKERNVVLSRQLSSPNPTLKKANDDLKSNIFLKFHYKKSDLSETASNFPLERLKMPFSSDFFRALFCISLKKRACLSPPPK
ncbi:hypothetical protein GWI33_008736 [Rhynchophorus ferrugineus]|uniref:Uncharacterized protein n=1 Tax=Rhynchophorus ferrugineus TaxID=354439 RepID=A0A834IBH1_RHYFE|nr:hypothetical protein GWI33_008736 [Rhynchophorus ferrugineus]